MKSLILMYVFYDSNNDIKAISPNPDVSLMSQFEVTTFPVDDVAPFLSGEQSPFDYFIKTVLNPNGSITKKIDRKEIKSTVAFRSLDNYLTKVEERPRKPIISIRNNVKYKTIAISIRENYKDPDSEEERDSLKSLLLRSDLTIHFTKHNNPYHLLHTIKFHPKSAFQDTSYYNYNMDLRNASVYTRKAIDSYGYFEEGK